MNGAVLSTPQPYKGGIQLLKIVHVQSDSQLMHDNIIVYMHVPLLQQQKTYPYAI